MNSAYRSIYRADLMVFAALALPGLNIVLIEFLLSGSFSAAPVLSNSALAAGLCGLAGVLGMAFSWLRIITPESRSKVLISLAVKVAAAAWLVYLAITVSNLIFLIAIVDLLGAVAFCIALFS